MPTNEAQRALISWEAVSSRIITAEFRTKMKNINIEVVQCYAPTNDTEDEKENFYNRLQCVLDKQRKQDLKLLTGSVFPHKDVPKAAWRSLDHVTENQTDHVCIGYKFRRSLQDVKVKRGADALSDHLLVMATLN